jgi:probable rRNA maturation factor
MIEINNLTNFAVDKKFLTGLAKKVLKDENRERENLSIAFVGKDIIKGLNKKYRKKNKPTDVLSFAGDLKLEKTLGEIVICPEIVKKNAKIDNSPFKKELAKVLIHGILHLLGYDHEKSGKEVEKMEEREKYYQAIIY